MKGQVQTKTVAFVALAIAGVVALGGLAIVFASRRPQTGLVDASAPTPRLKAAIQKARQGLPKFERELAHPKTAEEKFAVKGRFESPGGAEFIWVARPTFDGKTFSGRLADEPMRSIGSHKGDRVAVPESAVVDWLILDASVKTGGFTDQALGGTQ